MTQKYKESSPIWERLIKQGFSPYKYSHRGAFPRTGPVPLGPEETETRRLPFEEFEDLDEIRRRASEVDNAIEAENRQRRREQEEAAGQVEQAEEAKLWLESEARKCGLEAADVDKGRYAYPNGNFRPEFHFAYPDAEGAKVAFLLARACVQPGIEEPCNDAMGIIERRWSDPEFRDSLGLNQENNSDHAACFWWVLDRLKPTGKYRKLRQEASRYYQMQEAERRLEAERWRRRQEESPREPGRYGSDVSYRERRPRLPECMQREGGRCIRWR